jgi:signal transduction histidine kinase
MATTLAHELNQPLTAIMSYAGGIIRRLQTRPEASPEVLQALGEITGMARRAAEIVRGMRLFMRQQNGGLGRQGEIIDLNEVVRKALQLIMPGAHRKDTHFTLLLAPDLPPTPGSFVQLEQVVLNLLMNAIEAMQTLKGCDREITISTFLNPQGRIEITVADRGTGIPEHLADRIFDPFVTSKRDGLGMGLTISRTIVEAHSGHLWVTPNAGSGSTFHVDLPRMI